MKKILIALAFFLLVAETANAAEFRADVDRDKIGLSDSLTLQLTLSGAKPARDPDVSAIAQAFNIVSEGQSSSTEIFNGKASTTNGWVLTLVPKSAGQAVIPAITVETDAGPLRSDPVTIDVAQNAPAPSGTTQSQAAAPERAVSISAEIDNARPYKGQPVHYTVRVYARADIMGASMEDPQTDNAIVERQGEPEMRDQTVNGRPVRVIIFHYLVTPLQPGPLTIPPAVFAGQVQDSAQSMADAFAGNAFADPFAMLQRLQSMSGFGGIKPFSIKSNVVALNVAAPPVAMDPWLPLDDLKIHEEWDETQKARVGEPLIRKISLLAQNGAAGQLPSTEAQQNRADFKIYADKPRTGVDTDKATGATTAWRDESYSLIPEKYGRLTLPAIHIPYWNLKTNSLASADLPARIVDVQPATGGTASPASPPAAGTAGSVTQAIKAGPLGRAADTPPDGTTPGLPPPQGPALWLYAVITLLSIVLLAAIAWAVSMQRQVRRMATRQDAGKPVRATPLSAQALKPVEPVLDDVETPEELNRFLQHFARRQWRLRDNASLESIFKAWPAPLNEADDDRTGIARDLGAALYANRPADIVDLKTRVRRLIAAIPPAVKQKRRAGEKLPGLNPE